MQPASQNVMDVFDGTVQNSLEGQGVNGLAVSSMGRVIK